VTAAAPGFDRRLIVPLILGGVLNPINAAGDRLEPPIPFST
jgi:hypothetical protein